MDEEKMDVECGYEDEMDSRPSTELSKEEKLEKYKKRLEENLKRKLERIEFDKECDKIRKEFEKDHAEELGKIKESTELRYADEESEAKTTLSADEINNLKSRYKEYEARQEEILDIATTSEKLLDTSSDQMNAMVDEYISLEKLKLILVDRIRAALLGIRVNLSCDKFSKYNLSFKKATDNN